MGRKQGWQTTNLHSLHNTIQNNLPSILHHLRQQVGSRTSNGINSARNLCCIKRFFDLDGNLLNSLVLGANNNVGTKSFEFGYLSGTADDVNSFEFAVKGDLDEDAPED